MPAYLTGDQFLQCYDARRVGQWLSDNDTPLTPAESASSAILAELVRQAGKMIDSAATNAARYSRQDLGSLAADVENGGLIRRLCADLAYGLLAKRRGYSAAEVAELAPGYVEAMSMLDQLRLGERIFDLPGVPEAGLPGVVRLGGSQSGSIGQSKRFFGCLPVNRGNAIGGNSGDRGCGC